MELLFFWIASIIISFGMNISIVFRLFKDLADEDYKMNQNKLKEFSGDMDTNLTKSVRLSMFIPLINLLFSMKSVIEYNNNPAKVLEAFRFQGVLEDMTEFEIREYKKNPTGLNALFVGFTYDARMKTASKFIVKGDFGDSEFTYDYGVTDEKELTILNVEGPLKNLSEDEQKDILLENIVKETLIKDSTEFLKEINKEAENINFSVIADSKNKNITINIKDNFFETDTETNTDELPSNKDERPVLRKRLK